MRASDQPFIRSARDDAVEVPLGLVVECDADSGRAAKQRDEIALYRAAGYVQLEQERPSELLGRPQRAELEVEAGIRLDRHIDMRLAVVVRHCLLALQTGGTTERTQGR